MATRVSLQVGLSWGGSVLRGRGLQSREARATAPLRGAPSSLWTLKGPPEPRGPPGGSLGLELLGFSFFVPLNVTPFKSLFKIFMKH